MEIFDLCRPIAVDCRLDAGTEGQTPAHMNMRSV
jgi:hypothetical protein